VVGWLQLALGEEKVQEVAQALLTQLSEQREPTKASGVPWG